MRPACVALNLLAAAALAASTTAPAQAPDRETYFARLDRNDDGRIDLAEFQDYMSRGFRSMDRDRDGILQDHELPQGVVLRPGQPRTLSALLANLERSFRAMDRNGDGYLSQSELLAPPPAP